MKNKKSVVPENLRFLFVYVLVFTINTSYLMVVTEKRNITRINRFYIAVLLVLHGFIFPIDDAAELLDIGISELDKSCKDLVCSGVVGGCYVCLKLGNKCLRFGRIGTRAACLACGKLGKDSHQAIVCRCPFLFPVVLSLQGIIYHPRRG